MHQAFKIHNVIFFITFLFSFILNSFDAVAQNVKMISSFEDELNTINERIKSNSKNVDKVKLTPYFFPILHPDVYSEEAVKNIMSIYNNDSLTDDAYRINNFINTKLVNSYINNPKIVKFSKKQIDNESIVNIDSDIVSKPPSQTIEHLLESDVKNTNVSDLDINIDDIGIIIKKPNFWKTSGTTSLQFTQNYFSENWYKGGNNNQNLLASLILNANYNDQKSITWDNKLEMRLGFMTTTSDSCHKFLTSNDKLNLHSKLGIKAKKSWYYTATAEANTQFMPGYKSNDRRLYSKFFAPLDVFISIGMDFKPSLKNGNSFSIAFLPLSYKLRHLGSKDSNIHSVYNMIGVNTTKDYGSKMELNAKINLAKDFVWKCRCYYYTAYSYAEAELENAFTYQLSKYINAEVYTLWRFDDNRAKKYYDTNLGYFQFKEYFTLGLTYNF